MEYITVKEASQKWNISERRICILCNQGRISGAVKRARVWMLPASADKPEDRRSKSINEKTEPLLGYLNPDYCREKGEQNLTKDEISFCRLNALYLEGHLEEALQLLERMLCTCDEAYLVILYVMKSIIATDLGYLKDAQRAIGQISELSVKTDRYMIEKKLFFGKDSLAPTAFLDQTSDKNLIGLICFYHIKNRVYTLLTNGEKEGEIVSLELISYGLESLDCPAEKLYIHILLAVYYNLSGMPEYADKHLKKAADISISRKWYTPFAEYSVTLPLHFIKEIDEEAYYEIRQLSGKIIANYNKTGVFQKGERSALYLDADCYRVAYNIVMNKTNQEIMDEMGVSEYKLRRCLTELYEVVGSSSRTDIKKFFLRNIVI